MGLTDPKWTDEERKLALELWLQGYSFSMIAMEMCRTFGLGYSRNAVAGARKRYDWPRRKTLVHLDHNSRGGPNALDRLTAALPTRWGPRKVRIQRELARLESAVAQRRRERERRREEICMLKEGGLSNGEIAKRLGISKEAVRWNCVLGGVLPAGKPTPVPPRQTSPMERSTGIFRHVTLDEENLMVRMREEGARISAICKATGRPWSTVMYRLAARAARDEFEDS
jgi:hypothetical protein